VGEIVCFTTYNFNFFIRDILGGKIKTDTFDPVSLNIKELFGNTSSLFQIPNYQRPYSWLDDEVEQH